MSGQLLGLFPNAMVHIQLSLELVSVGSTRSGGKRPFSDDAGDENGNVAIAEDESVDPGSPHSH